MILGTRNFEQEYNGTFVKMDDALKMIDYFVENTGGQGIIDSAFNYTGSKAVLGEWIKKNPGANIKIQTKIWEDCDYINFLEDVDLDKCYSVLVRENNEATIFYAREKKEKNQVEKYGMSIYYPHELRSDINIIQIPCTPIFFDYIPTMALYAQVQIRSYYNLYLKSFDYYTEADKKKFSAVSKMKNVDFVIGCDDINQLRVNMEIFK